MNNLTKQVAVSEFEELTHKAANEALSISMAVQVLSSLPRSQLTEHQTRALQLLEDTSARLMSVIDEMKSLEPP